MRANGWWAAAALAGALVLSACQKDLTEINKNPNAPEVVPQQNLLLSGMWDVLANEAERGVFGYWTMHYNAENWAQHLAQPVYNEEDRYLPRDGLPGNMWNEMYYALNDLDQTKKQALAAGDNNVWAVAEIMTVYGFMYLSDYWGDIPYTDALKLTTEGKAFPTYTPQATVYPDLIKRLAAAAAKIKPGETTTFAVDPIYGGDMGKWKEFANALQLRLAIHQATSPGNAAARTAFTAAWATDIFDDNGDNATVHWTATVPSTNSTYYDLVYSGRSGDFRMSAALVDRMKARNDPRLPIYADPAVSDGQIRGLGNGKLPTDYTFGTRKGGAGDFSTVGKAFLQPDSPSQMMTYSEQMFIAAEAAARGWIAGSPATFYNQAITASMQQYGIPQAAITAYVAQPSVAYTGLQDIAREKWTSLFLAGEEAYVEMRRVGWMDLQPASNSFIGAGQFPMRLYYPPDEKLYNPANYKEVPITTPLWWATK